MIIKEKVYDDYERVYSSNPNKKVHILKTNIDKSMLIVPLENNFEYEEWDIDIEFDIDKTAEKVPEEEEI